MGEERWFEGALDSCKLRDCSPVDGWVKAVGPGRFLETEQPGTIAGVRVSVNDIQARPNADKNQNAPTVPRLFLIRPAEYRPGVLRKHHMMCARPGLGRSLLAVSEIAVCEMALPSHQRTVIAVL